MMWGSCVLGVGITKKRNRGKALDRMEPGSFRVDKF